MFAFNLSLPLPSFAHNENENSSDEHIVEVSQDPLSPLMGEKVRIEFIIKDKQGIPAANLGGELTVKKRNNRKLVGNDTKQDVDIVYQRSDSTDRQGTIEISYLFKDEGIYDVEFSWDKETKKDSVGKLIQVRRPYTQSSAAEIIKNIWLYVGLAFFGMIIGGLIIFVLLTMSLHSRGEQ